MTRNEWIAELRVLRRVRMVVGDKATGMVGSIARGVPESQISPGFMDEIDRYIR